MSKAAADSLSSLVVGATGVVRGVRCERPVARRLMEMGLLPGTRVSVTRVGPFGDPIELRVRSYALSIRRSEAAAVQITELHEATASVLPMSDYEPAE